MLNAMRGVASYDSLKGEKGDISKWKENLLKIFGERWYMGLLWPFAKTHYIVEFAEVKEHTE